MRRSPILVLLFLLSLLFAAAPPVRAQLNLQTLLDYMTYVQYEPVTVVTRVENELGTPAVFNIDEDDPRFYYLVKDADGMVVSARTGEPPPHPVMVPPGAIGTITNNLLAYFYMTRPGYYSVQPCVDWRGKSYRGAKKHFEIVAGREVSQATAVVPGDGSSRVYRLLHVNRNYQDHLLIRIDDDEARLCYGTIPLGRTIISTPPQLAVDARGRGHVVHRVAPDTYAYFVFSPMGYQVDSELYGRRYAAVNLVSRPDGTVTVNASIDSRRGKEVPYIESIMERKDGRDRER